jgi:predicted sugar kinase
MCLRAGEAGSGDTTVLHLSAALAVAEAYGARSTVRRVRALIVGANLQRGALDQADASWN